MLPVDCSDATFQVNNYGKSSELLMELTPDWESGTRADRSGSNAGCCFLKGCCLFEGLAVTALTAFPLLSLTMVVN